MKMRSIGLILVAPLLVISCGQQGVRKYADDSVQDLEKTEWAEVVVQISTLAAISPHMHEFPTGIETAAPNLDPREFLPPDSLLELFADSYRKSGMVAGVGEPERAYEILGEVEAPIFRAIGTSMALSHPLEDFLGPHGKPYHEIVGSAKWKLAFDTLRKRAASLGADAVIEVFGGDKISRRTTKAYDTGMKQTVEVTGADAGWRLMGLAVRWVDEPS